MIARCVGWVKEHPKLFALAATHLAVAAAVWFARGPAKTTTTTEGAKATAVSSGMSASHSSTAPLAMDIILGGCPPPGAPPAPDLPGAAPSPRARPAPPARL